ncbi:MAG: putative molybdenum carrier [Gemmataceae bacterium]|nr:putative molybdenum carrier [Gemmataceae bacterium]
MFLERVISGGQTGADRAGLVAAKQAGIATGGWMPKGFRALDGFHPDFAEEYGIREHESTRYPPRTALNVKESDGTIRFATAWESPGEVLTLSMGRRYGKPTIDVTPGGNQAPADVAEWLTVNRIRVLNVAGNTERTSPGLQEFVTGFLTEVFRLLRSTDDPAALGGAGS